MRKFFLSMAVCAALSFFGALVAKPAYAMRPDQCCLYCGGGFLVCGCAVGCNGNWCCNGACCGG